MNTRILLASLLLTACSFSLFSQEYQEVEEQPKMGAYKTTFQKNRFKDNWSITIGAGAQSMFGIDDSKGSFTNKVTLAPQLAVTKYFSPIWGLRLNFTGGTLHGYNDGNAGTYRKWNHGSKHYLGKGYIGTEGYPSKADLGMLASEEESPFMLFWDPSWKSRGFAIDHPDPNKRIEKLGGKLYWTPGKDNKTVYMQTVKYAQANIDFMLDVITLFGNYNPKRTFDLTTFAGIGVYNAFSHQDSDNFLTAGIHGGLIGKVRLSDRIGLNLEASGSMVPDDFDGQNGDDQNLMGIGQALMGISFKLGKTDWNVCEPTNYVLINDLNDKINDLQAALAIPCPTCPPCPEPIVIENIVEDKPIAFLPDPVFFRIDKSVIDAPEWEKIEKAVSYLKKYPEAKVVVTGYADKKTAYPSYNLKLSERRSKVVAKALIDKYGINPLRVSINWEGDQIQPFNINEWNRVVIFVLE